MKFRTGIVGCGRIGCGFDEDPIRKYISTHARAYLCNPRTELVALCDTDRDKLEHYGERFNVLGRYSDYLQMFERENLDIVSICTPSSSHLEIARAAVCGCVRGIFCEKPIADSLAAADEMVRLCDEREVFLVIDHQRRFDPMHQRLAQFVREGGVGRIQQATCYYTAGVANTGTHLFDLLRFYVGSVILAEGRLSASASPNAADPNIDGWLQFASGAMAAVQACDVNAYTVFEIALIGTNGRLRIGAHGFHAGFERAQASERYSGYRELFSAPLPVKGRFNQNLLNRGVFHLVECIEKREQPVSSGEDGRAALEIVCALSQSALESGRPIHLPLASEHCAVACK